ncbi:MobC family plasmid mobilization relaxosome protein [Kitasatospora sp. NPDC008050]|uniref:MobC family plasmid mobilization relaxosome protein n=1 Tax=Kitasatospora sp. NPDC008050 TaxID=3364021 RepID=UPI0036E00932
MSKHHPVDPDAPDEARIGMFARAWQAFTRPDQQQNNDGASWGKVHIAVGDADFALEPAPGVAGRDGHQGAPGQEVVPEGGHDQEETPDSAHTAVVVLRAEPTVTPTEFVHHGVAALDVPALPTTVSRPLSEILYRPRSGTKRDLQLTCSAEEAEREFIDKAAKAAKRSRSAYLMDCSLTFAHAYVAAERPSTIPPLPSPQATGELLQLTGRFLREMNRVGVNLNQIARQVNMGELPDIAEAVLDEVDSCVRAARHAFEHVISGARHGA